eukprot:9492369-Pyramimonas_sp.AAC.1
MEESLATHARVSHARGSYLFTSPRDDPKRVGDDPKGVEDLICVPFREAGVASPASRRMGSEKFACERGVPDMPALAK